MAYQKTAKDLAWDRERNKFQAKINCLERMVEDNFRVAEVYKKQRDEMSQRIEDLERVIAELTKGDMTPEEAITKMRKNAELSDMMKVFVNGTRGIF